MRLTAHGGAARAGPASWAALVSAMVSFQLGASFAERLFPMVGPAGAAALRLMGSALILAVVRRPWRGFRPRAMGSLIGYGLALGTMNTVFYLALERLPLGLAVAIEFLGPLGVAMLGSRRRLDLVWVALALLGVAALLPGWRGAGGADPVGVALALAAGVCWALYIVLGKRAGEAHGGAATGLGIFVATLVFAPLQLALQGPSLFTPKALPLAALVALLSSALPYSLEMYALTRLPQRVFGVMMSLEPAVAAAAGLVLLGQRLSPLQWLGLAAVVSASAGAALGSNPPDETQQPI